MHKVAVFDTPECFAFTLLVPSVATRLACCTLESLIFVRQCDTRDSDFVLGAFHGVHAIVGFVSGRPLLGRSGSGFT